MDDFYNKFNQFYKENSLKDTNFNEDDKSNILQHTYQKINLAYNLTGKNTIIIDKGIESLDDEDKILLVLNLLKSLNRNHIKKDEENKPYYSFIYEIYKNKFALYEKLEEYQKDVKLFNTLKKKYSNIKGDEQLQTVIEFCKIVKKNNINHFLFEISKILFEDNHTKDLETLFSILFHLEIQNRYIHKNTLTNNEFENIDALFLDNFLDEIYFC
ncbi:hypothetical protein OZZ08_03950 [Malaciobacter mytili]|uniref:hypothetical protein n=1 Tax=Malaciobacter mytili TaxID=603050 RepID=UPI003BAF4823